MSNKTFNTAMTGITVIFFIIVVWLVCTGARQQEHCEARGGVYIDRFTCIKAERI